MLQRPDLDRCNFGRFLGELASYPIACIPPDHARYSPSPMAGEGVVSADKITVLIPAAGRVPEGVLGGVSHISCTALIPVARRPVIYWTLSYLRRLGLRRFRVAVPQRGL